ncbi:hypothetical protein CAP36_12710 [Chitinophagaceae bacterium IBVUCB2]|nr:hypothetical protein CAP36_12710 [Chitinophagaceae bacterium IBVUCB2]
METVIKNKRTVLVVDNDEDMLVIIQHTLLREGYNPIFSPNAINLMPIILDRRPDLVLMDINMDGFNGADLCREIKSNPATADVPVVMYSGNTNIETIMKECGADGFLAKPFETGKLKQIVNDLLLK